MSNNINIHKVDFRNLSNEVNFDILIPEIRTKFVNSDPDSDPDPSKLDDLKFGKQFAINENSELILNKLPEYTKPALELHINPYEEIAEAGTQLNLNIISNFIQNDAGPIINNIIKFNDSEINIDNDYDIDFMTTLEDGENTISVNVNHSEGLLKYDLSGEPDYDNQIKAGTLEISKTIIGSRLIFATALESKVKLTPENIRLFDQQFLNPITGEDISINIPEGTKFIAIAIPEGFKLRYIIQSSLEMNILSAFSIKTILIPGVNDYKVIPYKVYVSRSLLGLQSDIYRLGL